MSTNRFAFYGSLRRGLQNYDLFKPHLEYRFSTWVKGFQLYSLGDFPFAFKTGSTADRILVEVVEITNPEIEKQIDELELGYGYHSEIMLIDQQSVKIYLFQEKANYPLVSSGDWLKFFRG